jgi:histone deacetylase 6
MEVTPAGYTHLLSSLLSLACGRVAVVLEGGYCLESLSEGAALTLRTLLGDPCPRMKPLEAPCERFAAENFLKAFFFYR